MPEASAETTMLAVEAASLIRGFANELAALVSAVGGLASAEASLSLTAFLRMLGLRALAIALLVLAITLLAVAATLLLAQLFDSHAAAMACVAAASLAFSWLAFWRAGVWRERIGFARTREALASEPSEREGTGV